MIIQKGKSGGTGDVRSFGGQVRKLIATFKYSAVYAAGREALGDTDSSLGRDPDIVLLAPTGGYVFEYDPSTKKVKALVQDGAGPLIEVADATNLTALEIPFVAEAYF
jgi:hypothetical protein